MPETLFDEVGFVFFEALISEQNHPGDKNALQISATSHISKYINAEEASLILFDFDHPELLAHKKNLGDGQSWRSENAFLLKSSPLCGAVTETSRLIEMNARQISEADPVFADTLVESIKNIIVAPLCVEKNVLGSIVFINPAFDFTDQKRSRFLQLMVNATANAIFAVEHNHQLIISKAELEASQWEIVNSRNTLRTFFDNIPICVYIVDRSYTIMAINSRRSERVNKLPHELVGGKCYEKLFGNATPCALCRVQEAFQGIPAVRNLREWGPKETFVHWEITTIPIRESANQVNRAIVFDEDITEKWILEANLIQSEKLASIGQLAANVAHEINNPLAAIIANAQLLLRDLPNADEDTLDSLKLIETAGVRAAKIVGSLLDSARREKRDEFEEFSLNQSIRDAIAVANYEIKNRSIMIKLALDENIPPLYGHKNQLKGVWLNLIINALGAVESNKGIISISSLYENNEYRIAFSDNGNGIQPEHQERIFEPFFTTKESGKGTGLGLYVSSQIIKEHNGEIHFETKAGKGTKFIIILPDSDQNEQ